VTFSCGSATSGATTTLAHGSHTITAAYSGATGFRPSTGSMTQVINLPPSGGTHYLGATVNTTLHVSASALAALDYDADGDALTITDVHSPSAHGTVALGSGTITYIPTANYVGTDQFTYTISDGYPGGTATSTAYVTVRLGKATSVIYSSSGSGGVMNLVGYGIPGNYYDVQHSLTADFASYTILASDLQAAPNGVIVFTDHAPTTPTSFYRLAMH
jgi:hypothetical protein